MESLFRCPICARGLDRQDSRYLCPQGHSFDRAREGYVHLLPVGLPANKMHSKDPGDDKGMATARNRFLSGEYYAPLRDALAELALTYAPAQATILDAGCGEGYYSAALYRALVQGGKAPKMAGVDLSKHALRRAAKREKEIEFAVASVYDLPVADQQADLLVNCFSPLALEEFLRVLRPGGLYFYVVPGAQHLWQLKEVLYPNPYPNEEKETPYEGFAYESILPVEDTIALACREDIQNLFQMTPYYWNTPADGAARLRTCEALTTEIGFRYLVYQKQ